MKKLASNNFSAQKGFTLIELVVVIVILGILAATAAPKFIDLTGDAKESVMKGVEGSIESAVSMVHAKAIVAGKTTGDTTVEIGNVFYALVNGYPAAESLGNGNGRNPARAKGIVGLLALAIPLSITAIYLVLNSFRNPINYTATLMCVVFICYSFFENLEILSFLYWPALLWIGIALNPMKSGVKYV